MNSKFKELLKDLNDLRGQLIDHEIEPKEDELFLEKEKLVQEVLERFVTRLIDRRRVNELLKKNNWEIKNSFLMDEIKSLTFINGAGEVEVKSYDNI